MINIHIVVCVCRPIHAGLISSGQKSVEGRSHRLKKPWPRWIGHVSTCNTFHSTKKVRTSVRHPRTHRVSNNGSITNINSRRVRKGKMLETNRNFFDEQEKYKMIGCSRPHQGYPHSCLSSLVLYSGEISSAEAGDFYRGYDHNWKIKGVLSFGEPIMGVRCNDGKGCQSGTKPLSQWGILNKDSPTQSLIHEIKRRLPDRI